MEETISCTRTELGKVKLSALEKREVLKKVVLSLEEGMKQLATKQKHAINDYGSI